MRVLILTAFYPIPGGTHERMFVHVRNQYYQKNGIDVTVLNFDAKENYEIDGIPVITLDEYEKGNSGQYDIAVSHSANLRNHYRFLKKYENRFLKLFFFFHGHEMLYLNKDYPKPYPFLSSSKWYKQLFQNSYDYLKIKTWSKYYKQLADKSDFIFVSEWVHRHFLANTGLRDSDLMNRVHIINNSIGSTFESSSYDLEASKEFDFITIRSNLDGSKYCIDLLLDYANNNPEKKFLLIGRGKFFEFHTKPTNITWLGKTISHEEMIDYLNKSRCALMLTREDTQGVMTCEMETYGIPTITSYIEVCQEFFSESNNVEMISNEKPLTDINIISEKLCGSLPFPKDQRFFAKNTIKREVELIRG
ncbi:MAG: glycosyltransferase [Clostridia bacterium]|nr:glycosyltransferase [Clostridia bacterium]